jgi:hypothetical protein
MRLAHAAVSLSIGFAASYFLAVTFFGLADFGDWLDRLFLILVPALAIGILLFQTFPFLSVWTVRIRSQFNLLYYLLGWLISLKLAYGFVGFFQGPLRTPFSMVVFTAFFITLGSVFGYYFIQGSAKFLHSGGFLSKPLNFLLVIALPVFVAVTIYGSLQFPSMLVWDYITVPQKWTAMFFLVAVSAGVWSLAVLDFWSQTARRLNIQQQTIGLYEFLSKNLPGLYAGGMFFLINLIIARALNHPALSYNSVLFEADAGPWMNILAGPEVGAVRSVHPLSLVIIRPLVRLVSSPMGEYYELGGMLVTSAIAGLCVFMAWLFVKRATDSKTHAFLFAILLGSSSAHLLFGSLTENYIYGAASLILFFLLIQAGEQRFAVLLPAGILLFGITISNIAQGVIGLLFNKFGIRRLLQFCISILALGVLLTIFTGIVHPGKQGFFFLPADIAFELNFVSSAPGRLSDPMSLSEPESIVRKLTVVARSTLLYGILGPTPIEAISDKPPFPTIDLKTFDVRTGGFAPYRGIAKLPVILWLALLAGSLLMFVKNFRTSAHTPLLLGLLGAFGFNVLLHLFYGTELFLYSSYWVYALVFFCGLALSNFADNTWFQWGLAIIVLAVMVNNAWFIFAVQQALAPFYAAAP